MRRAESPRLRDLLLPLVVVVVLLGGLQWFQTVTAPRLGELPPPLAAGQVPPPLAQAPTCQRASRTADQAIIRADVPEGVRVTSEQVLGCPQAFDGLDVTYVGELIGDLLPRGEVVLVLANDDAYALHLGPLATHGQFRGANSGLTLTVPQDQLPRTSVLGRPGQRGDLVMVTGRVQRTQPDGGAGPVLRVEALETLAPGGPVRVPVNLPLVLLATVAVASAGAMTVLRIRAAR